MTDRTQTQKAEALLSTAYQELEDAAGPGGLVDVIKARDAAAKAWAALIEACRALFLSSGLPERELPTTHRGTRYMLRRYAEPDMRNIYSEAYEDVHQDAYYDGLINLDTLTERFSEIGQFIERLKERSG